jgi:FtsP/CotA-like multicopper oxidase with cupredoxin domain
MIIHEAEGGYLKHTQVKSLDIYPGQSYSVLLYTNKVGPER